MVFTSPEHCLGRYRRITLHFTPTSASWLNQIELWFSLLSRKVIRREIFPSTKALIDAIMAFIARDNQEGGPFRWTYTPEWLKTKVTDGTKH